MTTIGARELLQQTFKIAVAALLQKQHAVSR
jgi:hypothetical protein